MKLRQEGDTRILRISLTDWEHFATATLEGVLLGNDYKIPENIVLEVEQTSMGWKLGNGGPESIVLMEYTPMCLIESILSLTRMGKKITVVEVEVSK